MKILSPAKINLFLHVTGKRADGYHNLLTLMCCISLYDVITMDFLNSGISVHCDSPDVPDNEDNLAFQAAAVFFNKLALKDDRPRFRDKEGVSIGIEKHIPVAAGLGGGSSNAGTILFHLNRHFQSPFSDPELNAMALSVGADVPFFLLQKPALARGVGEKLTVYEGLKTTPILLVCPEILVSTAATYKKLNLRLTKCQKELKQHLFEKHAFDIGQHLCNDLERVTISEFPVISDIKRKLLQLEAKAALMTGSGPGVFGVFSDATTARYAYNELSMSHAWRVYMAEILV
jgi:4-diphosphocytidyl-2-C-methyl-D-erythritol kinase